MFGVLLALLGGISVFLVLCLLILLGVTWYESSKAKIPPGTANPSFLWRMHFFSTGMFILGDILEKLGIWNTRALFDFLQRFTLSKLHDYSEISKKDLQFEGVPVRVYQPRSPSAGGRKGIMFIHGGGFVIGSIDMYESFCQYLTKNSGAVVVSVGYRLAPKHVCPAAFDDCLSATIHFLKTAEEHGVDPSSVILCGDSAGGCLTAGVCQALVGRSGIPQLLAQVLMYPVVQMFFFNLPSHQQNKMAPLLSQEKALYYTLVYLGSDLSLKNEMGKGSHVPLDVRQKLSKWLSSVGYKSYVMAPFNKDVYAKVKKAFDLPCSPLLSDDTIIRQLPKTYILTCEFDGLRDDAMLYKKRLEDNEVPVTWFHVKDGFHGIVSFFDQPEVVSGKLAMDNVVAYIKNL